MATDVATIYKFPVDPVRHEKPAPRPRAICEPSSLRELTVADGKVLCEFMQLLEEIDEQEAVIHDKRKCDII